MATISAELGPDRTCQGGTVRLSKKWLCHFFKGVKLLQDADSPALLKRAGLLDLRIRRWAWRG